MPVKITNNARGTLAGSLTDVATGFSLSAGQGVLFPSLSAGEFFYATITNAANAREIVKVTARSIDALTVVRGQDGTTAVAWSALDVVELRPVAAIFTTIPQIDKTNTFTEAQTLDEAELILTGAAATKRQAWFQTDALKRWVMGADDAAESGTNAGSDFVLESYADEGTLLTQLLKIVRSSGLATWTGALTVTGQIKQGANKVDSFAAGVTQLFRGAAAPTGWTRSTTTDDAMLRLVGSATPASGGTVGVATAWGSISIAQANLPAVNLSAASLTATTSISNNSDVLTGGATNYNNVQAGGTVDSFSRLQVQRTLNATTTIGGHVPLGGSGTPIAISPKYFDMLLAVKDA